MDFFFFLNSIRQAHSSRGLLLQSLWSVLVELFLGFFLVFSFQMFELLRQIDLLLGIFYIALIFALILAAVSHVLVF